MKHLLLFTICTVILTISKAQNNVGIGTQSPHASAQLDVSSTTKGLLAPRMTTAQRTTIVSPAKGLLVYDTDANSLFHYNGSSWVNLAGGGGGGLTLPFAATPGLPGVAFQIDNTGVAIQASSTATSQAAIVGSSAAVGGYGLVGQNHQASGFGVAGFSTAGSAVFGSSTGSGTALRGTSSSGYGLLVSGNLRLFGGNTNPSAGAVLTSTDANGNAVWAQPHKVAFRASGVHSSFLWVPNETIQKVHFASESYDHGNSFQPTTSSSPSVAMSSYVVPVSGVYHWEVSLNLWFGGGTPSPTANIDYAVANIMVNRGGNVFPLLTIKLPDSYVVQPQISQCIINGSSDNRVLAGDIIYVDVRYSGNAPNFKLDASASSTFFSGRLVIPD